MKVIIVGGGQIGSYVANLLLKSDCEVKVIDHRESVLEKLRNEFDNDIIIEGDGADPRILELAGIASADVVATVTGSDEVNLVVSTIAKYEFGISRVIARVNHPRNEWLFTLDMGVDVKVSQAELMAHLVVDEIDIKNMLTLMKLNRGDYSIIQVNVDDNSQSVKKAIKDLEIPDKTVLIAVTRDHEMIIPNGDTVIKANDNVLVLTDESGQVKIEKLFG